MFTTASFSSFQGEHTDASTTFCPAPAVVPTMAPIVATVTTDSPVATTEATESPVATTEATESPVATTEATESPVATTEATESPVATTEATEAPVDTVVSMSMSMSTPPETLFGAKSGKAKALKSKAHAKTEKNPMAKVVKTVDSKSAKSSSEVSFLP